MSMTDQLVAPEQSYAISKHLESLLPYVNKVLHYFNDYRIEQEREEKIRRYSLSEFPEFSINFSQLLQWLSDAQKELFQHKVIRQELWRERDKEVRLGTNPERKPFKNEIREAIARAIALVNIAWEHSEYKETPPPIPVTEEDAEEIKTLVQQATEEATTPSGKAPEEVAEGGGEEASQEKEEEKDKKEPPKEPEKKELTKDEVAQFKDSLRADRALRQEIVRMQQLLIRQLGAAYNVPENQIQNLNTQLAQYINPILLF